MESEMNIFEAHKKCWDAVEENDYYVNVLYKVFRQNHSVINSASDIKSFWNDFWYELPDSPSIHREPFNLICEICEGEFDE